MDEHYNLYHSGSSDLARLRALRERTCLNVCGVAMHVFCITSLFSDWSIVEKKVKRTDPSKIGDSAIVASRIENGCGW